MTEPPRTAVRLIDIRDTPLEVAEVLAVLADDTSGGVTLFVGQVRNHDDARGVDHLEYSAHPTAVTVLQEVADDVAAEFDVSALAAVHRIGRLEVGDIAVVVAVAAPHRGSAFDASRALIDRLKQRAPIWKHQVFTDGADEWVGTP